MLGTLASLNYAAVVAAAVAALVIGFVWYLPPLLGTRWARYVSGYTGAPEREILQPADPVRPLGLWAVAFLLNALVLALLVRALGLATVGEAVVLGVLVWVGLGATFSLWPVAFARQPWGLWAVNNGAHLLMQVAMATILTLWR